MSIYEELFKKGEYQKIVEELELSTIPQEIWLVVDSYVQMNQIDNAIRTIENNREILLKDDPKKLMFLNIDLYLLNNDFVKALTTFSYFEELPYISIEVEELLPSLKQYIYKKMNDKSSKISDSEIIKNIKNYDKKDLFLKSVYEIQKRDIKPFLSYLKNALISDKIDDTIKSLILILLVEKHVDDEVKIIKDNKEYIVTPHYLDPILTMDEIEKIVYGNINDKDVSILNLMSQLIAEYALKIYPDTIFEDGEEEYILAFYMLANEMFQKDTKSIEDIIEQKHLNKETILSIKKCIKETLNTEQ
ncbi:MAG: hypothetical protein J1F31_04515 [Erysipelotrichales bacterium]|nr:hypothetical protein [Erysipelotrichales bacterium]